jgi:hypothetical protein
MQDQPTAGKKRRDDAENEGEDMSGHDVSPQPREIGTRFVSAVFRFRSHSLTVPVSPPGVSVERREGRPLVSG